MKNLERQPAGPPGYLIRSAAATQARRWMHAASASYSMPEFRWAVRTLTKEN
jgi:hypothetical protein